MHRMMLAALLAAAPAWGQDDSAGDEEGADLSPEAAYAQDIFLSVFYHEMGHALIDVMQLPVLGLEEDAADVLSALLIHTFWDEEYAVEKATAAADFWAANAEYWAAEGVAETYWGTHSPDERRYSTYVCIFYGGNPDARADFAADMGLPDDRAGTCPDEFTLADESWGVFLDEAMAAGPGESLVWEGGADSAYATLLQDEIDYFNGILTLPAPLTIRIAECGESNAFYDPADQSVTMCTELIDDLERLAQTGSL
jgi:hypothetical protein